MTFPDVASRADGVIDAQTEQEDGKIKMDIGHLLDELAEAMAQRDLIRLEMDEAIPAEIKTKLSNIATEFAPRLVEVDAKIVALEAEARQAVLTFGNSVRGDRLHAVYSHGRAGWNDKGLTTYSVHHPEILRFRTLSTPIVTIRKVSLQGGADD